MKYSPTWINDNFEFNQLECQYLDICKFYDPGKCGYDTSCQTRQYLRSTLENFVAIDCEKFQIDLIVHPNDKETEETTEE